MTLRDDVRNSIRAELPNLRGGYDGQADQLTTKVMNMLLETGVVRKSQYWEERMEFRVIPEFPNYMIDEKGFIKHIRTGKFMKGSNRADGMNMVTFYQDKKKYHRSRAAILRKVFPPPVEKTIAEKFDEDPTYRDIPGFPKYVMDAERNVFNKDTGHPIKPQATRSTTVVIVAEDGNKRRRLISDLFIWTWPDVRRKKIA